jgi:glycosyltransferase involved in cell wall biosynthesis
VSSQDSVSAPPAIKAPLLCSIIITNYNNCRFVAAAIESALAQTHGRTEIIVVDDGSTDESLRVIRAYEALVTFIPKRNGGQASAMNSGFAASRGEIVFFLDSDDKLAADVVERVVLAWHPRMSKVHFRLQQIGANGMPIPALLMPPYGPLPSGNLAMMSRRFGFYPSPPTTGNAFARTFLERVMPIPESTYRIWADTFLIGAAPFLGEIGALDDIGGFWRRHPNNLSAVDIVGLRHKLRCDVEMTEFISSRHQPRSPPEIVTARWPQHLKERLIVEKFGRDKTVPGRMRIIATALAYLCAICCWPEYHVSRRLCLAAWAVAMLLLPRRVLMTIANIAGRSVRIEPQ